MKIVKWNNEPVFPAVFNRFFNDDFDNYFNIGNRGYMPATNVVENEKEFEIEIAAPGMEKEDIRINIENNVLTISSEKEVKKEEKEKNYTRREFSYGSFCRSFTLPKTVDVDHINASYEKGILKVALPKKEEEKTKLTKEIRIS
jgi:HSP20 family protein